MMWKKEYFTVSTVVKFIISSNWASFVPPLNTKASLCVILFVCFYGLYLMALMTRQIIELQSAANTILSLAYWMSSHSVVAPVITAILNAFAIIRTSEDVAAKLNTVRQLAIGLAYAFNDGISQVKFQ